MQRISYYWGKFVQLYLTPRILKNCRIGRYAKVCSGAILNDVEIGDYSYIGHNTMINNCKIGKFCSIAGHSTIGGSSHPIGWISTSPVFHDKKNITGKYYGNKSWVFREKTCIGNDVWIGSGVMIKSGVTVGDGAVIGMGSVLTKNIPPYEIWAGNPAKKIKDRFENDIKEKLLNNPWWNGNEQSYVELGQMIDDPARYTLNTERE